MFASFKRAAKQSATTSPTVADLARRFLANMSRPSVMTELRKNIVAYWTD